jgi:hypothetical protein
MGTPEREKGEPMPGREEALARARQARNRSVSSLQNQFVQSWFPGGEGFEEPVIRAHDAAHQWSNISPTQRGELQQQILDIAGTQALYEQTGARGFVNSYPVGVGGVRAEDFTSEVADRAIDSLRKQSKLIERRFKGTVFQESLPVNDPARLQFPEISQKEVDTLRQRGREFYGAIGDEFLEKARPSMIRNADPNRMAGSQKFMGRDLSNNAQAEWIHGSGDRIKVVGGHDKPGLMSFGPDEARLNRPLQYTVDQGLLLREANKQMAGEIKRDNLISAGDIAKREGLARRDLAQRYGLPEYIGTPDSPEGIVDDKTWNRDHGRTIKEAINTGMGQETSALQYATRYPAEGWKDSEILDIASRARKLTKIRSAIRTGANVTTDIAGSVPLFDPEFRSAIERGDMGEAAKRVGIDYAVGTATAPAVGMAAGTLQRLAPQVAARALPAVAGATRIGNPVAVVSQIGGDSRQSQAQVVAAQQAAERQLNRAREARQRGGRWGVGPLRLPELGISEAGGLLFGGNKSGRQVGTRATLGGKSVVWTGDNYGWQSPASANKIGVR